VAGAPLGGPDSFSERTALRRRIEPTLEPKSASAVENPPCAALTASRSIFWKKKVFHALWMRAAAFQL
jgi:hypothetical protein